ncbi:MAG TPA: hypothetical protein VF060_27325 [Trebonia sp.]
MNEGTAPYEHQPHPDYQQAYAGPQHARQPAPQAWPKHPIAHHVWRNLFRYCFLAVQAVFLVWLITGLGKGVPTWLIIGLWVTVDVILGIGCIIVLFGRHHPGAHR